MMPPVDYAILSEWFQWITGNTNVHLDLIGEFCVRIGKKLKTIFHMRYAEVDENTSPRITN